MLKKIVLCWWYIVSLNATPYQEQAVAWLNEYITPHSVKKTNAQELRTLANLVYFSYLRSATSISAQKAALKLAQTAWQNWENIAQTRMNPAQPAPYQSLSTADKNLMQNCLGLQEMYQQTNQQYVFLTDLILKDNGITSEHLTKGIKKMREQARTVVACALVDVKAHIQRLIEHLAHSSSFDKKTTVTKSMVPDFLLRFIPSMGMQSFIEIEKSTHVVSEESWKILSGIQAINSYIWHVLEMQRASFYLAYYRALYRELHALPNHAEIFSILNHVGKTQIASAFNMPLLPNPDTLILPMDS